jgi:hypothetical protein
MRAPSRVPIGTAVPLGALSVTSARRTSGGESTLPALAEMGLTSSVAELAWDGNITRAERAAAGPSAAPAAATAAAAGAG